LYLLAMGTLLLGTSGLRAQQSWGTIKGQVVWQPQQVPVPAPIPGAAAVAACPAPLLDAPYLVDARTRGVRWVMVWLADAKDPRAALPIHPRLAAIPPDVEIDQPGCLFEPRLLAMRQGQKLVAKNSSTIVHNVMINGGSDNPNINVAIPPKGPPVKVEGWKASNLPVLIKCSIHPWMGGYIRVFNHPYHAITNAQGEFEIKDAPAGNYRLVIWHPEGWVQGGKTGIPITIKANGITTLDPIKLTPPD
jgi:hypothetical protein